MSIEKMKSNILKHEQSPFTTMFNQVLQGINNMEALGIYCYLASKPENWIINKKELENHFNCGREKVNVATKKLIELGLIEVISQRTIEGKFAPDHWVLKRNFPNTPPDGKTVDGKTVDGKTVDGKTAPINKRDLQIKESTNNIYNAREEESNKTEIKPVEYQDTYFAPIENCSNERFLEFWTLYPVKKNARRANAIWDSSRLDKRADEILKKLKEQISKDSHFIDGYIPTPSNYLNDERWNDEITPKKVKSSSKLDHDSKAWATTFNEHLF